MMEQPCPFAFGYTSYWRKLLADIAAQLATFKGDANAYLDDSSYNALRHRLEIAHAAVEAATVEARRR